LDENLDAFMRQFDVDQERNRHSSGFPALLMIQSRSRLAAATVFYESIPALQTILTAFDCTQEQFDTIRAEVEEIKNKK